MSDYNIPDGARERTLEIWMSLFWAEKKNHFTSNNLEFK